MDDTTSESLEQRAPLLAERRADPCVLVLFGATGDLARRKLLPGLYNLFRDQLLPEGFAVIAVGRSVPSLAEYRAQQRETVARFSRSRVDPSSWEAFEQRIDFVRGDIDDNATYVAVRDAAARAD